jgi:hypothetical protein
MKIPDFVTHYHLGDRRPFLNLSDLDDESLEPVRRELQELRRLRTHLRPFGRQDMELRRLTEGRLHELFQAAGGKPERAAPHYFVLGRSRWFESHAPDTRAVVLPLDALPDSVTSFTYPDSFEAMGLGERFGLTRQERPYHDRVFRMRELPEIVEKHGLPGSEVDEYWGGKVERYIEVQLWSDEPVASYLKASGAI